MDKHSQSKLIKFLFDENLSKIMMNDLLKQIEPKRKFEHLTDKFKNGTKDEEWIPKIAKEGGWTVLSLDLGKGKLKGGFLPVLCEEFKVTHILLSAVLGKRNNHYRLQVLLELWDQILEAANGKAGLRYFITLVSNKTGEKPILTVAESGGKRVRKAKRKVSKDDAMPDDTKNGPVPGHDRPSSPVRD